MPRSVISVAAFLAEIGARSVLGGTKSPKARRPVLPHQSTNSYSRITPLDLPTNGVIVVKHPSRAAVFSFSLIVIFGSAKVGWPESDGNTQSGSTNATATVVSVTDVNRTHRAPAAIAPAETVVMPARTAPSASKDRSPWTSISNKGRLAHWQLE
jgi:hypothetical protein